MGSGLSILHSCAALQSSTRYHVGTKASWIGICHVTVLQEVAHLDVQNMLTFGSEQRVQIFSLYRGLKCAHQFVQMNVAQVVKLMFLY